MPFWYDNHGCQKYKYEHPKDYVGLWDIVNEEWVVIRHNDAYYKGLSNVGFPEENPGWGHMVMIGLTMGWGPDMPCWRDFYAGGALVYLSDWADPSISNVDGVPDEWIGDGDNFTITADAYDAGLGVHDVEFNPEDTPTIHDPVGCSGLAGDRCPTSYGTLEKIYDDELEEGRRWLRVKSIDALDKGSEAITVYTKVDRTPPKLTLGGQLAHATDEAGSEEKPAGEGDELSLPVYRLSIDATDGSNADADLRRSGVNDVRVYLDGVEQNVPWEEQSCPEDSCPMHETYDLELEGSEPGEHLLEVNAEDHVGEVRYRDIEFEYAPSPEAERPQTTITSLTPSFTRGEISAVEFESSEPGSTFKCSLEESPIAEDSLDLPCQSPYSLPQQLDPNAWHTFAVYAIDEEGNADLTPAVWRFKTGTYPPAPETNKLTAPEEGEKSASHYTLQAAWDDPPVGADVRAVAFQMKFDGWEKFQPVPAECVIDGEGEPVSWPLPVSESPGQSEPVFLAVRGCPVFETAGYPEEEIKFRAAFDGGRRAAGASEPVEVEFVDEHGVGAPTDATEELGPAVLDLLTGRYTVSRTDVSIPVPGSESTLEFTRVYESNFHEGEDVSSHVLGGMWQPSTPAEQEAEGLSWAKLRERHRDAVPPVYEEECWEGECVKWLVEYGIPAADWVEVLDNEGAGIAFDKKGGKYVAPDHAKEYTLTKSDDTFKLADPNGVNTVFKENDVGVDGEYRPISVSMQSGEKSTRLLYEHAPGTSSYRLTKMIAPAPPGVSCPEETANEKVGCRTLTFHYSSCTCSGSHRLSTIRYHDATGIGYQVVAQYEYDASHRLVATWDPRMPVEEPLEEKYAYGTSADQWRMHTLTPPGEEPWQFSYYDGEAPDGWDGRLASVSRASLLEDPAVATTSVVYDVPISGEDAPYEMGPSSVAEWAQADYPVNATAIFPPNHVPEDETPEDYSGATIHYLDPDGYAVNTASTAPPGVEGDAIGTSETDRHGNVVRSLSAQARLDALADENPVARSKQLDTHSTYNAEGTELLEEWGPLHEVQLESGETVEAREYKEIEYDEEAPEVEEDEEEPHLPTTETVGAQISGQEGIHDKRVTKTEYNWELRLPTKEIVDPEGLDLQTVTVYDQDTGLVLESRQPSDPAGEDAGTTVNAYYSAGTQSPIAACRNKPQWANLPCVSYPKAEPSPEGGNPKLPWTWTTSYNGLDLPTETQEKVNGEPKRATTATYDSAGRPLKSHEAGEGVDLPPSEILYSESTGAPVGQRLLCEEECEGFDEQTVTSTFDALGRPIEYEDADGNVSGVAYDLLGRSALINDGKGTQTATYDEDSGVLTQLEDSAAGTFTATYDADGRMTEAGLPNGLVAQATYDEAGSPVRLSYEKTLCAEDCTWLEFEREESIHGQVLRQQSTLSTQQYGYDAAGRLILAKDTEEGKCTTRAYSFDANTNRAKLTTREPGEGGACDLESKGETQDYSYDTADRLTGEGVEYDNLGRITSLPSEFSGGGKLTTTYYVNDLTRSQTQGGITNTYELDAGLRQRKRTQVKGEEESTEIYHYANGSDSPSWVDEDEGQWSRFIGGIGASAIQKSAGEEITLQLADMHGDIVATADIDPEATELLSTQQFDEYGNPKSEEASSKLGWLGSKMRRTELPSGVIQMGVRSYVPTVGRFVSTDPVFGGSASAYDYSNGDPVNTFDLTGLAPACTARSTGGIAQATFEGSYVVATFTVSGMAECTKHARDRHVRVQIVGGYLQPPIPGRRQKIPLQTSGTTCPRRVCSHSVSSSVSFPAGCNAPPARGVIRVKVTVSWRPKNSKRRRRRHRWVTRSYPITAGVRCVRR